MDKIRLNPVFLELGVEWRQYDGTTDLTLIQEARQQPRYALSFLELVEIPRKHHTDSPGTGTHQAGVVFRWKRVPNKQRASRIMWGKINRACKRLAYHGWIAWYVHTLEGALSFAEDTKPLSKTPYKHPPTKFRHYHEQWVQTPEREQGDWRKQDKRLDDQKAYSYAHIRTLINLKDARKPHDYAPYVKDIPSFVRGKAIERLKQRMAEWIAKANFQSGGTCSTWTLEGAWRKYVNVPLMPEQARTTEQILSDIHEANGCCVWPPTITR
jgi:hypothetical protein